jgi:hypothetical protein
MSLHRHSVDGDMVERLTAMGISEKSAKYALRVSPGGSGVPLDDRTRSPVVSDVQLS